MKRTQAQLPESLYDKVKRVAEEQEWSVAEVLRRGAEYMVRCYPTHRATEWRPPEPQSLGPFKAPAESWRELADPAPDRL